MKPEINDAVSRFGDKLVLMEGVVGVGIGSDPSGNSTIVVYTSAKVDLPKSFDGYEVVVIRSGEFYPAWGML